MITTVGFSQDKVSEKSSTPMEAIIVKKAPSVEAKQKILVAINDVVVNDIVLVKQSSPVENKIVTYIGTPKSTYIEPIPLVKKESL